MCKVYNQIGSLTYIKSHLRRNNVNDFNSINELLDFQKNYSIYQQQIISKHSILIEKEKDTLNGEIKQLEEIIEINKKEFTEHLLSELEQSRQQLEALLLQRSNIFYKFINNLKSYFVKRKLRDIELNFDTKVEKSLQYTTYLLSNKKSRLDHISSNILDAVNESALSFLQELERKKKVIDEINNSIHGAIGEHMVLKDLENLSDDYVLINDFSCTFNPPLYNRQENDYIKSIQIDHILISPSGIFLIETKNWSEQSLKNLSLRSPVEQIRRTSFALFRILADKTSLLDQHHWGDRKIPIRNLIVLINQKPNTEFQYVKILTLKELRNYVEYFKQSISLSEVQMITEDLIRLNESNN
jgi:hypothetical protein